MSSHRLPAALSDLEPDELLVNEVFHSIQGESTHAGRPCVFIRLTGCPLRCRWCDTAYAFQEGARMRVETCVSRAVASGCDLVEVTGGEPLAQPAIHALLSALCDRGLEVLLETGGSLPIDAVDPRVRRIVDWKTPGSGEAERNRPDIIPALRPGDELKLVILDRHDYTWARSWLEETRAGNPRVGREIPVHFSPVHGRLPGRELASWIIEDRLPVRLHLQLHKIIWPPDTHGV